MLDILCDTKSLTVFCRSTGDSMKWLKNTKRPMTLTVNGKAAVVIQDAEAYRRLLDIVSRADAYEGIRQGLDDVDQGRTRAASEFFEEFRAKHGIDR